MQENIRLKLHSFDSHLLVKSCQKIILNLEVIPDPYSYSMVSLPSQKRIYCVLRSPHVDKDSREHFEIRIHKRILDISYDSSIDIFDLLLKSELPSGISYEICLP